MTVHVNGEPVELTGEMSVTQLLEDRKVKMPDQVVVELNGEILDREAFESTTVKEDDRFEFLYFMGGGR